MPVDVACQVCLLGQIACSRLRRGHVHQDGPVADQNRDKQDHLGAHLRQQENHRGDSVTDRDPLQDTRVSLRFQTGTATRCCRPAPAGTAESPAAQYAGRLHALADRGPDTSSARTARRRRPGTEIAERSNRKTGILPISHARTARRSAGSPACPTMFQALAPHRSPPTIQNMSKPRRASIDISREASAAWLSRSSVIGLRLIVR